MPRSNEDVVRSSDWPDGNDNPAYQDPDEEVEEVAVMKVWPTLLDMFAAHALTGLLAHGAFHDVHVQAYNMAHKMMKRREELGL